MAIDFKPPDFLDPSSFFEGGLTNINFDSITAFISNNPWVLILVALFAMLFYHFFKELAKAQDHYGGRA